MEGSQQSTKREEEGSGESQMNRQTIRKASYSRRQRETRRGDKGGDFPVRQKKQTTVQERFAVKNKKHLAKTKKG